MKKEESLVFTHTVRATEDVQFNFKVGRGRPASEKLLVVLLRISTQFQAKLELSSRAEQIGFQSGEYTKLYRTEDKVDVSLVESTADTARS